MHEFLNLLPPDQLTFKFSIFNKLFAVSSSVRQKKPYRNVKWCRLQFDFSLRSRVRFVWVGNSRRRLGLGKNLGEKKNQDAEAVWKAGYTAPHPASTSKSFTRMSLTHFVYVNDT